MENPETRPSELGPYRDRNELVDSLYVIAGEIGKRKPRDSEVVFVIGQPTTCDRYWHPSRETPLEFDQLPCTYRGLESIPSFSKDGPEATGRFIDEVVGFTGTNEDFHHCTILMTPDGFIFGVGHNADIDLTRVQDRHPELATVKDVYNVAGITYEGGFVNPIYFSAMEVSLVEPGLDVVMVNGKVVHLKEGHVMRSARVKREEEDSAVVNPNPKKPELIEAA